MRAWMLGLGLAIGASPLVAQQSDRGIFNIQRGEAPLGREEFTTQPSTQAGAGGTVLASLTRYPATGSTIQIQTMLEQNAAGAFVLLQIDTRQPSGVSRVYGAALKDNLTIRQTTPAAESVREYPRAGGFVILDDSVFALYQGVASRATPAGVRLPVLFPRSGRRGQVTATLTSPTTVEMTGVVSGTLTIDPAGRLMRVILSDGVSAIRQSK